MADIAFDAPNQKKPLPPPPPVPFDAPPTQPKPLPPPQTGSASMPSAAAPAPPPPTAGAPTPSAPKPGADWIPTADGQGWLPPNMAGSPAAWQAPTAGAAPAPGAPAPAAAPPPPDPMAQTPPAGNTIASSFRDALVNKLNPGAVNASNAAIAPAIEANKLAEQRGMESSRNLLAERAAKDGTDASGGFDTQLTGLAQDRAAREGQFAGNAVQHLQDQQNSDLMAALGLSNSTLQANANRDQQGSQFGQTLAEQAREANQSAENQKLGINTQSSLGQGDLSLRGRLGEGQLNLGLAGLLQGGDQFTRQLNQQGSQFGAGLDQQGLLGLLGLL